MSFGVDVKLQVPPLTYKKAVILTEGLLQPNYVCMKLPGVKKIELTFVGSQVMRTLKTISRLIRLRRSKLPCCLQRENFSMESGQMFGKIYSKIGKIKIRKTLLNQIDLRQSQLLSPNDNNRRFQSCIRLSSSKLRFFDRTLQIKNILLEIRNHLVSNMEIIMNHQNKFLNL